MRRLSADEYRTGVLQAERDAFYAPVETAEDVRQPTHSENHASRMLVDGFGLKGTADPGPTMQRMHEEFVNMQAGGTRTRRTLDRLQTTSINRSSRRFIMQRDWANDEQVPK